MSRCVDVVDAVLVDGKTNPHATPNVRAKETKKMGARIIFRKSLSMSSLNRKRTLSLFTDESSSFQRQRVVSFAKIVFVRSHSHTKRTKRSSRHLSKRIHLPSSSSSVDDVVRISTRFSGVKVIKLKLLPLMKLKT